MKNFKKLKVSLLVAALALFSFAAVNQFVYTVDTAHSRIGFTVKHLGISDFNGQFDKYETKISGAKADFSDAVFEFSADAASINTFNSNRDEHLKSEDFFNTEKFEKLTFKSTSVKVLKGNKLQIVGDFTMHGVTKSVTLDATHTNISALSKFIAKVSGYKDGAVRSKINHAKGSYDNAKAKRDAAMLVELLKPIDKNNELHVVRRLKEHFGL